MDIFERIKADHDQARAVMKQICGTDNDAEKKRDALFRTLSLEIWAHHKVEEATFYEALKKKGEVAEAYEAQNEHHMINTIMDELATMPTDSEQWQMKFSAMTELLTHHLDEEEEDFFPMAKKKFSADEAIALGRLFDDRKNATLIAITPIEKIAV
jgi:hemerythrin superfamily protein